MTIRDAVMAKRHSFYALCKNTGKSSAYVRRLQRDLDMPADGKQGYTEGYLHFMKKVVALRSLSVPTDEIHDLLFKEKKILEMLNVDTLGDSPTWYVDAPVGAGVSASRLMLTGQDLGFPVRDGAIQSHLDFGGKENELFEGGEMGEDVRRVLGLYVEALKKIEMRVRSERRVLKSALEWAREAFG